MSELALIDVDAERWAASLAARAEAEALLERRRRRVQFHVIGNPQTQGNKTGFVRGGRVVMVEGRRADSRRRFKDWRGAVADAAREECEVRGALIDGPVVVAVHFALTRPKSHPKRRRTWPVGARSGDLDKLARAVFDAVTGTLIRDDAQVVALSATKDYGDPPGVWVLVEPVIETPTERSPA